ncbi:MAG: class II fumarate hydratase [Hyphomicrobiales bacterium]|nr:class II fumarate hydratase [Hyphomicrobiales bacterium]MDE2115412.1 class II fumarate hydratase [Hyphomicrobiales bacterium]
MDEPTRTETDSFGAIEVPAQHYWGAQTQRSLETFRIGSEPMPLPIIHALGLVKQAAALVNGQLGLLPAPLVAAIARAAQETAAGEHDGEYPLRMWQTGSGTQTNMNVNEVIANLANERFGSARGTKSPVHPNDHVNLGQSSNDSFPTAMHIATVLQIKLHLFPALDRLHQALEQKAKAFEGIIKIGRTHLQDATPISLGQEFSGYSAQVALGRARIEASLPGLLSLAQGATAVGTGLNTHRRFAEAFAAQISALTGQPFKTATNKFEAIAAHDAMVFAHGALAGLASGLFKIGCDIRLMGSGPRAGLGELRLPENEPGSSIMPGKVNPTQIEALCMVCAQVMGNNTIVTFANSQGQFELNVFKPLIANAVLQSIALLADAANSFAVHCVSGIEADAARIDELLRRSLMLVTALVPMIGYDKAAGIAKHAHAKGITLREAALQSGFIGAQDFDRLVRPETMIGSLQPAQKPDTGS